MTKDNLKDFFLDTVCKGFEIINELQMNEKTGSRTIVGRLKGFPDNYVMATVCVQEIRKRSDYGEKGEFYDSVRKRKVKNKETGKWEYVTETVQRYRMSEGDKRFVHDMYVYSHLDGSQINLLSGIPQPYIYRYIKHYKLKPCYDKLKRSERKTTIDFTEPFELDPFPTASEWKARREEFGLKNGENWRNSPEGSNPGKKIYGSGKTSAKKKLSKLKRKEERKKRNIQKFNSHQNNRYGISEENPNGTKDPYKQYRESLERKKNGK